MTQPYLGRTVVTISHAKQDLSWRTLNNVGEVVSRIGAMVNSVAQGSCDPTTTVLVEQGGTQAYGTVTLSGVGGTQAAGSVALTDVGGTAASNTVTLGGGAGNVTIVTDGTSVGPVAFNSTDAQTATDAIAALNLNSTFAAKATASSGGSAVVLITWNTKGTVGNSKTLTASRTAGTATVGGNGTTLGSGAQGSVGVTVDGTTVTTNTTNLTDTASATAIAAALTANTTVSALVTAVGSTTNVNLTAVDKGVDGNSITLSATTATGTAVRSAATLENGADGSVAVVVAGTTVTTDTTNITDEAAATAVAAAVAANSTVDDFATATASGAVVTVTANEYNPGGNLITLTATTSTGTSATGHLSGGKLSGGAYPTGQYLRRP